MKPVVILLLALSTVLNGSPAVAAGTVQVSFVNPDRFADVRDRNFTSAQNLAALERVLIETAGSHVPDGSTLKIDVLDVDLAGEVRPGSRPWDVRVLRGRADWPRITLRWALDGASPKSGNAVVQDMAYLQRIQPPMSDGALVYERRMLDEYFRGTFGKPSATH
jgi:hypothetical protein